MDKTVITGDGIVHMSYAKQRVDSEMVPAGRFVLMLDCMLTLAININIQRKGKVEAVEAEEFLINCIEERILTLALWAGGGVEVLELVRFIDTEKYDLAKLAAEVERFCQGLRFCSLMVTCGILASHKSP